MVKYSLILKIVQLADIPLTYVPGNVTRIIVKAIGDLTWESQENGVLWDETMAMTSQYDDDKAAFTCKCLLYVYFTFVSA